MHLTVSRPIAAAAVAVVAVALVWVFGGFSGGKPQMTRVGGTMNQCTCSQRLEK